MSRRDIRRWLIRGADPLGTEGSDGESALSPRDLRRLLAEADAHAVLPAVMNNLPPWAREGDYEEAWGEGLARRRVALGFAMMLRGQAEALLSSLRDFPVALVKGRAFATALYPNPAFRTFTDIDLLVDPSAILKVHEALTDHGFRFADYDFDPDLMEEKWVHAAHPTLMVEAHTNMVHHPGLRKSISLAYEDLAPDAGSPAALLAVAVIHGASHQFERLQQAVDIRQAARALTSPEDEERFLRLMERCGGRLAAIAGLELAARLFDEPRCRAIRNALGRERYSQLSRLLVSPRVVASTKSADRIFHSWRRNLARELLKRGRRAV